MVNKNLIAQLGIDDKEAEQMVAEALGQRVADGDMEGLLSDQIGEFKQGSILKGKIIGHVGDAFLVEIGLKSEGILERDEFPWTIAEPMVEQGLGDSLVDASALFASVRQPADDAENGLAWHAQKMAETALDAVPSNARRASIVLAPIESSARRAGAEEVLLRIVPDLAASAVMQRVEGESLLGKRFAVQVSLAYKGVWVRSARNFSASSEPSSWNEAKRWFAEAAANMDASGPAKPAAKLDAWTLECCIGTPPLSMVAEGGAATQSSSSRALPKGALAVLSARLALPEGAWFDCAPVVLGGVSGQ